MLIHALLSFGLLTTTMVSLAQIPALRVRSEANKVTSTKPIAKPTVLGDFDPKQLRQWDAPANGRFATSESGTLTIGGKRYKSITNEFTPKGTFIIGKPYVASNTGVIGYPFKVEFVRDLDDRNPAKSEFLKLRYNLDTINSYAVHAGLKTNGCIVLSPSDMEKVGPLLEGTTITIK